MFVGKLVFAQLMDFLPLHTFRRCVARYPSSYPTKTFSHLDQFLCMAFAQLTFRESLRDIEVCLRAQNPNATVAWAGSQGGDTNRLGIIGFCRGGRTVWLYASAIARPSIGRGVSRSRLALSRQRLQKLVCNHP